MSKSYERNGVLGKYIEHYDDQGNKIGESREINGVFGKYTEHRDREGRKIGESRDTDGVLGKYTEHRNHEGRKSGESRDIDGVLGKYTEHRNHEGRKIGESRDIDGVLGKYTDQKGGYRKSKYSEQSTISQQATSSSVSNGVNSLSYDSYSSGNYHSETNSGSLNFFLYCLPGIFIAITFILIGRASQMPPWIAIASIPIWPLHFLGGCIAILGLLIPGAASNAFLISGALAGLAGWIGLATVAVIIKIKR